MAGIIPIIAIAGSLFGTGMSAFGQYRQGQSEKASYDYNARVAEQSAIATKEKYGYEEEKSRKQLRAILGEQRALYGAGGVDITSGSPLLTMLETTEEGEEEARNIRRFGEVESTQKRNQAKLYRFYGKQAKKAGLWGAGSTFFSGLSNAGSDAYGNYKTTGKWI